MKVFPLGGFFVFVAFSAMAATARSQVLLKEPDSAQLSCGQKVLVENRTCPEGQILEIVGSCRDAIPAANSSAPATGESTTPASTILRGVQYNCIKRK
jgi:hypothetical protein